MAEQNGRDTESAKVGWMMVAILIACLAMALLALCHTGWKPFEWFRLCERRALNIYITVLSWAFAAGAFYLGLHRLSDKVRDACTALELHAPCSRFLHDPTGVPESLLHVRLK